MRTPPFRAFPAPIRRRPSRALLALLVAGLALPVAGCARSRAASDLPYVARDVGTLYSAARSRLDQGRYKEAAALFDEVERQHPYSVWARRAQLMSAFSYYLNRDYTESIQSAQRFLAVHPGNRDAPYAYYLIALGYYEQISDVTRDQKITAQAQDALGELVRRYPNTRYAADARLKVDLVRDHLAGKEMEIGRFYERRRQWLAANGRFRRVIDEYQTTTHTPEALMRLTETYLALGVRGEARNAAAVLGANYPGSEWYDRAYKLMGEHPATPARLIAPGENVVPPTQRPQVQVLEDANAPDGVGAPAAIQAPTPPTPATTGSAPGGPTGTAPGGATDTAPGGVAGSAGSPNAPTP